MRLIARYAKEKSEHFEVITVYDTKVERQIVSKEYPTIDSLAKEYPAALWFERKMSDDFGIKIEGSFDTRALVHHERFPANIHPMRKSFQAKELAYSDFKAYPYEVVKGEGVFEVGVGPIHAGIIEPGHFHFSQSGERILHQEVRHFYKYRGIEKMLEGKRLGEAKAIIERISGNESIAYQIALRDIWLEASETPLPKALQQEHALLLELERVIHHLTDLGFIPNDAGFAAALAFASKLAEDARRWMQAITGHRFGFEAVEWKTKEFDRGAFLHWLETVEKEIAFFEEWVMDIPSLLDRLDTTGILSRQKALKYGVVGVMARASGVALDRRDNAFYKEYGYEIALEKRGDVAARFKVRIKELKNSLAMMKHLVEYEEVSIEPKEIKDGEYFAFVESSIGELFMAIEIQDGVIDRFFARDPSFINWQALHTMMLSDIIADFPLINKSCDLSYAGNDL